MRGIVLGTTVFRSQLVVEVVVPDVAAGQRVDVG